MNRGAMLRAAAVAAALAAAACSREEAIGTSDVAARVNGGEVPVGRVQAALQRDASRADPKHAGERALESAIDQELLVQKALAARLDRDPDVMRALDESRRRILARAWLDHAVASRAQPDAGQVDAFYAANPALFAERRIYSIRRLSVPAARGREAQLAARAAAGDRAALEAWLAREGLAFEAREATEPAEALPLALLAKLHRMKDGEATVVDADGVPAVVELVRSIPAPLASREAAPVIERFLASRRRGELAREEVARLRGEARIEYVGDRGAARQRVRPASPAVPVNASLEATYDGSTDSGLAAAHAAPGKDERS
jgi:EpsD family peptidyl-prolyl cis-trans isomerase